LQSTDKVKLAGKDVPWPQCDTLIVRGITIGRVLDVAVPVIR